MLVNLHPVFSDSLLAREGASAIEACVHCGFCLATCPTYLDTRDERDSPRGRIYLVKELLETGDTSQVAQYHLDRCLTCRSCESTCPSGVRYGEILHTGRVLLEENITRGPFDRLQRWLLRRIVPFRARVGPLLRIAQALSPLMPATLKRSVPPQQAAQPALPVVRYARHVILLEGCIQGAATPATNACARRILHALGIGVWATPRQGCCGALDTHLGAEAAGLAHMRRNIDAWWPALDSNTGVEALISTATGCGAQLSDYAKALAHDPDYAERAARVSDLAEDLAPFLLRQNLDALPPPLVSGDKTRRIAVHVPCSQSHALQQADTVRHLLEARAYTLTVTREDHLCCGSAGTYSLLQPAMSDRLRRRKLDALLCDEPEVIVSANIGCQLHLQQRSPVAVQHWTELFLASLPHTSEPS